MQQVQTMIEKKEADIKGSYEAAQTLKAQD